MVPGTWYIRRNTKYLCACLCLLSLYMGECFLLHMIIIISISHRRRIMIMTILPVAYLFRFGESADGINNFTSIDQSINHRNEHTHHADSFASILCVCPTFRDDTNMWHIKHCRRAAYKSICCCRISRVSALCAHIFSQFLFDGRPTAHHINK